jgi:hypothetical protein
MVGICISIRVNSGKDYMYNSSGLLQYLLHVCPYFAPDEYLLVRVFEKLFIVVTEFYKEGPKTKDYYRLSEKLPLRFNNPGINVTAENDNWVFYCLCILLCFVVPHFFLLLLCFFFLFFNVV